MKVGGKASWCEKKIAIIKGKRSIFSVGVGMSRVGTAGGKHSTPLLKRRRGNQFEKKTIERA